VTLPRLLSLAGLLLASGCCFDPSQLLEEPAPPPRAAEQELGVAAYPADTPPERATTQRWQSLLVKPPAYRFGYALDAAQARAYQGAHEKLARALGYRYLGNDRMTFTPTPECQLDLRCVYQALERTDRRGVRVIAQRFLEYGKARRMSSPQLALLIITYVQSLRYERPRSQPFDVLPPALVAFERWGDCDSKSLLAYMLLRAVGVDCVLLRAPSLAHVALGIRTPGEGFSVSYRGRRYLYVEMTYPNWPVGTAPPDYNRPAAWSALPLDVIAAAQP
jgi:hypothetical protein